MALIYPKGSLVRHINRPDVPIWVVIFSNYPGAHLLRSLPTTDHNGVTTYEVIRGDHENLVLILGPADITEGQHKL